MYIYYMGLGNEFAEIWCLCRWLLEKIKDSTGLTRVALTSLSLWRLLRKHILSFTWESDSVRSLPLPLTNWKATRLLLWVSAMLWVTGSFSRPVSQGRNCSWNGTSSYISSNQYRSGSKCIRSKTVFLFSSDIRIWTFDPMGLFVESWSPINFHWLFCIQ